MEKIKGEELIFISRIKGDGSGVIDLSTNDMIFENETKFTLTSLSITHKTYIASEFNSYVVKKRDER